MMLCHELHEEFGQLQIYLEDILVLACTLRKTSRCILPPYCSEYFDKEYEFKSHDHAADRVALPDPACSKCVSLLQKYWTSVQLAINSEGAMLLGFMK